MPNVSKLFAKRLSEDDYEELKTYLDGKTTFSQVGSKAQKVLKAITKPEHDRTFDEEEKLFEMKTKLITDKYIQDSNAWDQFELVYRTFWLGASARQKFFNVKEEVGKSPGGIKTKSARVDPSYNYNVEKWEKIGLERFWDDKKSAGVCERISGVVFGGESNTVLTRISSWRNSTGKTSDLSPRKLNSRNSKHLQGLTKC